MTTDWESRFSTWAAPPSKTEQDKCDNAERAVRNAITSKKSLNDRAIQVFAQGSYRNRTNVRQDSDVDICVMCTEGFFFDLPDGKSPADFDISTPASYPFAQFRNDIQNALTTYFGAKAISRGNKAFDIHENTYRVDADVVAAFEYRRYATDGSYIVGTSFLPDSGDRIINWPNQNYDNGVQKNDATSRSFKAVVRILKNLCNEMHDNKIPQASRIPSFLIECLVWNVPDDNLLVDTYKVKVRNALAHLFNNTRNLDLCKEWGEINELKYLFSSIQPWDYLHVHQFIDAAWNYIGLE